MVRSVERSLNLYAAAALSLGLLSLLTASGCAPLLATGMYIAQGGNVVPPEYEGLEEQRVVVVCRPPSSHEYRHAGASSAVSEQVSELLVKNVDEIDVVNPDEVDNWLDKSDWSDYKSLGQAVHADKVVFIEMNDFDLYNGKTLYQGRSDISVTVYDMKNNGKLAWDHHLGEILYPQNSGIPAQDKPVQQFEREFITIISTRIAQNFYKHDANSEFAMDALANH